MTKISINAHRLNVMLERHSRLIAVVALAAFGAFEALADADGSNSADVLLGSNVEGKQPCSEARRFRC